MVVEAFHGRQRTEDFSRRDAVMSSQQARMKFNPILPGSDCGVNVKVETSHSGQLSLSANTTASELLIGPLIIT